MSQRPNQETSRETDSRTKPKVVYSPEHRVRDGPGISSLGLAASVWGVELHLDPFPCRDGELSKVACCEWSASSSHVPNLIFWGDTAAFSPSAALASSRYTSAAPAMNITPFGNSDGIADISRRYWCLLCH